MGTKHPTSIVGPSHVDLDMAKILSFLEENKQLKVQVERLKDTLITLNKEYKKQMENPSSVK